MSDLISRSKLLVSIQRQPCKLIGGVHYVRLSAVQEKIRIAPSADAVEVVHGRWDWLIDGYYCSECDHKIRKLKRKPKYCENCGAKMDGGEEGV